MKHHIQMPNFDDNNLRYTAKAVVKFAGHHKNSILAGTSVILFLNNIIGRIDRKKDRSEYRKRELKHQKSNGNMRQRSWLAWSWLSNIRKLWRESTNGIKLYRILLRKGVNQNEQIQIF